MPGDSPAERRCSCANWRVIKMIILNDEKIHKMIRPRMNFASSALQGALLRWAGVRWPIETKAVWGERKPVKVRDGRLRCMMVDAMLVMSDDCYRITWSETSLIDENSLSDFRCRSGRYPTNSKPNLVLIKSRIFENLKAKMFSNLEGSNWKGLNWKVANWKTIRRRILPTTMWAPNLKL